MLDDFERETLGPAWYTPRDESFKIRNGSDLGADVRGTNIGRFVGQQFGTDQYSEATFSSDFPGLPNGAQVCVRMQAAATSPVRYCFEYDPGELDWQIKYDGGGSQGTGVVLVATSGPAPRGGDVIRIEAQGPTLRGYLNGGSPLLTTTHPALTDGHVGVGIRPVTAPVSIFESWEGGDL